MYKEISAALKTNLDRQSDEKEILALESSVIMDEYVYHMLPLIKQGE